MPRTPKAPAKKPEAPAQESQGPGELGFTQIVLMGRMGTDPEMRYTPEGTAVTDFRLAVNHPDSTSWFTVTGWDRLAEFVNQYLEKGRRVLVSGRLEIEEWTGKDGQTRHTPRVTAATIRFADGRPEEDSTE